MRPRAVATAATAGSTHQASARCRRGELDHAGGRHALALHLALQLLEAVVDDVQGAADGGGRLAHLVGEPSHVPEEERPHALLDDGTGRALGLDGHHRVDEGGGVDHAQRVAQVAAPARHRRVGQEELVELALQLGGQVARGAPQPDLLCDLRHDLLDVGLRVLRHRHFRVSHAASLTRPG